MRANDAPQDRRFGVDSASLPQSEGSSVLNRPKIMRIITRMNIGGPALHVLVLSDGLQQRGYSHVLVSGVCEARAGKMQMAFPAGHRLVLMRALSRSISPARDIVAIWSMYRWMRRERPDI